MFYQNRCLSALTNWPYQLLYQISINISHWSVHSKTVRTVLNATLGGLPWQSKPSSDIEQTVVTEGGFHFSAVFEFNVQSDEMLQVLESWCGDLDSSLGIGD